MTQEEGAAVLSEIKPLISQQGHYSLESPSQNSDNKCNSPNSPEYSEEAKPNGALSGFMLWYRDIYIPFLTKTTDGLAIEGIVSKADNIIRKGNMREELRTLKDHVLISGLDLDQFYADLEQSRSNSTNNTSETPESETKDVKKEAPSADDSEWFKKTRSNVLYKYLDQFKKYSNSESAETSAAINKSPEIAIPSARMRECQLQIALYLLLLEYRQKFAIKYRVKDKSRAKLLELLDDHVDQLCLWATLGGPIDVVDFGDANDAAEAFICSPVVERFRTSLGSIVEQLRFRCGCMSPKRKRSKSRERGSSTKSKRKGSPRRLMLEKSQSLSEVIVSQKSPPNSKSTPLSPKSRKLARHASNQETSKPLSGTGRMPRLSSALLSKIRMECTIPHKRTNSSKTSSTSSSPTLSRRSTPISRSTSAQSTNTEILFPSSKKLCTKSTSIGSKSNSNSFGPSTSRSLIMQPHNPRRSTISDINRPFTLPQTPPTGPSVPFKRPPVGLLFSQSPASNHSTTSLYSGQATAESPTSYKRQPLSRVNHPGENFANKSSMDKSLDPALASSNTEQRSSSPLSKAMTMKLASSSTNENISPSNQRLPTQKRKRLRDILENNNNQPIDPTTLDINKTISNSLRQIKSIPNSLRRPGANRRLNF